MDGVKALQTSSQHPERKIQVPVPSSTLLPQSQICCEINFMTACCLSDQVIQNRVLSTGVIILPTQTSLKTTIHLHCLIPPKWVPFNDPGFYLGNLKNLSPRQLENLVGQPTLHPQKSNELIPKNCQGYKLIVCVLQWCGGYTPEI